MFPLALVLLLLFVLLLVFVLLLAFMLLLTLVLSLASRFRFDTVEGLRLYLLCNAYADASPVLGIVAIGRAIML